MAQQEMSQEEEQRRFEEAVNDINAFTEEECKEIQRDIQKDPELKRKTEQALAKLGEIIARQEG